MKIAVVFPGIGYHTDKPLLFYSKKIAAAHGYEVRDVSYGNFPSGSKGKKDLMADCFFSALEQSEKLMADVDFSRYDDILFLSKSIGTAVASAYSRKHGLKTKNVYFTPPEGSFRFMDQPGIVFHGSSDEMADTVFVTEECRKRDWSLHTIENANHSLEVGDWERDLGTLYGIMLAVDQYLTETEKQPEHIAGTVKLDVVMNAVEMADDMSTYFLDTKTGESIFLSEMDRDDAAWDEIEDAEPGRYLRLPTQFDIHEYKSWKISYMSFRKEKYRTSLPMQFRDVELFGGSKTCCTGLEWNRNGINTEMPHSEKLHWNGARKMGCRLRSSFYSLKRIV